MKRVSRHLAPAAVIAICVIAAAAVRADDDNFKGQRNA
jgi:hypothetical protein